MYGYDLGVPVNWSAYEDIAEFFTDARARKSTA
jgi:glycerol transport system substrate-binding protein